MADAHHPSSLGPFEVLSVLDSGGMGVVYRGRAPDGTEVAIKLALEGNAALLARFEREASIRIDHPNVVRILETGLDAEGRRYIAMELLDGASLDRVLETGLSITDTRALLVQACDGLQAVHAQGIVHRDLKPANLFRCRDGTLKLLDFGIAQVRGVPKLTAEGALVGTLAYLSPEQARGRRDLDVRSDIWALGAVLFELLTGVSPFERDTAVGTLMAILNEPMPRLPEELPRDLVETVERCLQRAPEARYPDVETLAHALRGAELGAAQREEARRPSATPVSHAATRAEVRLSIRTDERRLVTVLLARGVTDLDAVEAAVVAEGGTFFPLLATDAVGIFGGLRLYGDELPRAVRAGLRCRLAAEAVSVGAGRIGTDGGTLAGAALEDAQRGASEELLGVAVSPAVAEQLEGFRWRRAGERVEVFAEAKRSWRTSRATQALVGRDLPLMRIDTTSRRAFEERLPACVLVSGAPGIGKSALAREVAERWVRAGVATLLVSDLSPAMREQPGAALLRWLEDFARRGSRDHDWPRIEVDAPPAERRMALAMLLRESVADREAARRHLDALCDVFGITAATGRLDPALMRDRLRAAFVDVVQGRLTRGPVGLLLENAQWLDEASAETIAHLLGDVAPLAVLATTRTVDPVPRAFRQTVDDQVPLSGLDRAAVAALVADVQPNADDAFVDALMVRSEGNPLFLQQVLRELGRDRSTSVADLPLPMSVEAAVQSRLDHLPEAEKECVKWAALMGRAFLPAELPLLDPPLEGLVRRGLLRTDGEQRAFESALLREVAARSIARERRAQMHLRLARHLAERAHADPAEVADHFVEGGAPALATEHSVAAALRAQQRGDGGGVLRFSERALGHAAALPPRPVRFRLHLARADARRTAGDREGQAKELELALPLAETDAERLELALERVAWCAHTGDLDRAVALADEAIQWADTEDELARCLGRRAEVLGRLARFERAHADLELALRVLPACEDPMTLGRVHEQIALVAAYSGDVARAGAHFAHAVDHFHRAGHLRGAVANRANLADMRNRWADYAGALAALDEALLECRKIGFRGFEPYVLANRARALAELGRFDDALTALDAAEAAAEETMSKRVLEVVRVYRVYVLLGAGETTAAAELADRVRDEIASPGYRGVLLAWRARLHLLAGAVEAALACSEEALTLRDQLGGLPEDEVAVFVVRVEALQAAGATDEARRVLEAGRRRLEEVGAAVEDEDTRRRLLEQPDAHARLHELVDALATP